MRATYCLLLPSKVPRSRAAAVRGSSEGGTPVKTLRNTVASLTDRASGPTTSALSTPSMYLVAAILFLLVTTCNGFAMPLPVSAAASLGRGTSHHHCLFFTPKPQLRGMVKSGKNRLKPFFLAQNEEHTSKEELVACDAIKSSQKMRKILRVWKDFRHGALRVFWIFPDAWLYIILLKCLVVGGASLMPNALQTQVVLCFTRCLQKLSALGDCYTILCRFIPIAIVLSVLGGLVYPLSDLFFSVFSHFGIPSEIKHIGPRACVQILFAYQRFLSSQQSQAFTRIIKGPIFEEIQYRLLPALVTRMMRGKRRHETPAKLWFGRYQPTVFLWSVIFGIAHIGNHISFDHQLPSNTLAVLGDHGVPLVRAIFQSVISTLFSLEIYWPLYNEVGLVGSTAAHMAWNALISLGLRAQLAVVLFHRVVDARRDIQPRNAIHEEV